MTRQNIAITVAIAVVCFAAGYWLAMPGDKVIPKAMPPVTAPENGIAMRIVSIRDTASSQLYRITGEYPQFGDASNNLNAAIANYIASNLAQFKSDAQANEQARQATMPPGSKETLPPQSFYFTSNWQPEQINGSFISIIARIEYYDGGANETQLLKTFNYDVMKKKTMTLADLFPNVPNRLQQIAQLSEQELTNSLNSASNGRAALDILKEGTTPTADHYANFTFNDDVVKIYFPKYQVAPGVFGEQKVIIVRATIR
jgi:Protein of unknown function (DUF3298)/Deacetylase PdaC